jgi:hypothetical protein
MVRPANVVNGVTFMGEEVMKAYASILEFVGLYGKPVKMRVNPVNFFVMLHNNVPVQLDGGIHQGGASLAERVTP